MRPRESDEIKLSRVPWPFARRGVARESVLGGGEVGHALGFALMSKIWALASGPVTLILIARHLTPVLQGYYYTFWSLMALQSFVELSLYIVITQFASHEWAYLRYDQTGEIVGEPHHLCRLMSLGRFAFKWYAVVSGTFVAVVGTVGYAFFSREHHRDVQWMLPWFALVLLTAVQLWVLPFMSLLEGCNQVSNIYLFRLIQGVVTSVSTWSVLMAGGGLWTTSVSAGVGVICSLALLWLRYREFFRAFLSPPAGAGVSWRWEIWPVQWRLALQGLVVYFVFSFFTPVMFHYQGAVGAGQMGMTWSLVSALSGISSAWILTKAPRFGVLIARKEYGTLDRLFFQTTSASFVVAVGGATVTWAVIWTLNVMRHPLAGRLLPPFPTGLFLVATVLMQISYAQTSYVRAHKREPFLGLSVVSGVAIGLCTWLLGSQYGAVGMGAGYLSVVALLVVPWGTWIWQRCRTAWHAEEAVGMERTISKGEEMAV